MVEGLNISGPAVCLIEAVLKEHLGSIPASLAASLLRKGPSAVYDILEATGLKFWQVRNSLLTLIQHNVVNFISEPLPHGGEVIRYFINVDEALLRLRFPAYGMYVAKQKGPASRLLFTQILKTGRASLGTTVKGVLDELREFS